jgi:transposase
MARRRLSVRKTREIIRLDATTDLSARQIAQSCGVSPTSVGNILSLAREAGLSWPLPEVSDSELKRRLYANGSGAPSTRPMPDFVHVAHELRRKGVTLRLLWTEYRQTHPEDGYGYSQFCEYFRRWRRAESPTMRFEHKAGEKLFVDWAGATLRWTDGKTGIEQKAYLFVAVLGASNYTYAGVFKDMSLPSWIRAHVDAFEWFGGVSALIVPDNTRTAITRSCRYDPDMNPTYQQLAEHYGTAVLPARVKKPRDKAKVENAVQNASRWIVAALRDQQFLSFGQLRKAVRTKLEELNGRPFSKMDGSRDSVFREQEAPALKPLPGTPFNFGLWKKASVYIDYHVQVDSHYYSVPYRYVGNQVDVRLTDRLVEIFHDGLRIALHSRSSLRGKATTLPEHRTQAQREIIEQSAEDFVERAAKIGPRCAEALREIQASYPHPEMSFRGCRGVLRLARKYGRERLEAACGQALDHGVCRYRTIRNMLENRREGSQEVEAPLSIKHRNIRGGSYYGTDATPVGRAASC